jgi:hypothetical protein
LIGDGDELDLIEAIESSFGVTVAGETVGWNTVGDVYETLLGRIATDDVAGKCSTSMAFYRVRNALLRMTGAGVSIRPDTKLSAIVMDSPKQSLRRLAAELGVAPLPVSLSWIGKTGLAAAVLGVVSAAVSFALHGPPFVGLVAVVGIFMIWRDPGAFEDTTVGDIARSVAVENFAHFAASGADRRAQTIWKTLCELVVRYAGVGVNPSQIGPRTRLLA